MDIWKGTESGTEILSFRRRRIHFYFVMGCIHNSRQGTALA